MYKPFTSVRIGPFDFEVRWGDNAEAESNGHQGYVNMEYQFLWLNGQAPRAYLASIFIHEVQHAILFASNLPDQHTVEDCVTNIGRGLVSFWRDNPEVVKWWTGLIAPSKGFTD